MTEQIEAAKKIEQYTGIKEAEYHSRKYWLVAVIRNIRDRHTDFKAELDSGIATVSGCGHSFQRNGDSPHSLLLAIADWVAAMPTPPSLETRLEEAERLIHYIVDQLKPHIAQATADPNVKAFAYYEAMVAWLDGKSVDDTLRQQIVDLESEGRKMYEELQRHKAFVQEAILNRAPVGFPTMSKYLNQIDTAKAMTLWELANIYRELFKEE